MNNYPPELPAHSQICFGQHWDANAVECKGGLDPSRTAEDGSSMHPRCPAYAKCASETIRNRVGQKGTAQSAQPPMNIPISTPIHSVMKGVVQGARAALVRHVTQPASPVVQPPTPAQAVQPFYGYPQPIMVHPAQAAVPYVVPMNYQAPGMQMPAYLTVQEPVVAGQHWSVRLLFNIGRAMVKAGAHTTANFVDHTTINQPVYYQPNPPEQG